MPASAERMRCQACTDSTSGLPSGGPALSDWEATMNWFLLWLFLHILAAVIAFGPLFVFPIVGTMAAQAPQNMRFATELNQRIETRLVVPLALTMLVSGSGLIWTADINFFRTGFLIVAVALYLVALIISIFVLLPTTKQMLVL